MTYSFEKPPVEAEVMDMDDQESNRSFENRLSSYVRSCWDEAKVAKAVITERLLKCERQRRGEYDPERLADINRVGGSDIFMMLTDVKCRAAESWIRDVMLNQQDRVFDLKVSSYPTMPPEMRSNIVDLIKTEAEDFIAQGGELHPETFRARMEEVHEITTQKMKDEAEDAARRMGSKIEDQLEAGAFNTELKKFITDYTTFPTAVVKGPIIKRAKNMAWGPDFTPIVVTSYQERFERVSPYDIFPAPASTGVNDAYLIHRHRLSLRAIETMRGTPGVNEDELATVISRFGISGYRTWIQGDNERRVLAGKPFRYPLMSGEIETVEFWGSVPGTLLLEWGIEDEVDPDDIYEINAWWTDGCLWKCVLNPDPLGDRPYHIASWEDIPDSFWGFALGEIMRDTQIMCNAAARSIANNMSIASGPQVEIAIDRLPDGEQITEIYPWKIWQTTSDRTGGGQPAVRFFQPNMNAGELMQVFSTFAKQADEVTGIPNYVYGSSNVSGAGRTASGLSMLMDNASKGIKQAIANIDTIVSGIVQKLYLHNMMFDQDPYIKGDFKVVAKGAMGLLHKETLQMRRNEFLMATNNPVDSQITGVEGRAYLLREAARGLQMDTSKIVPDQNSIEQSQINAKAQQLAQQMHAQMMEQMQSQAPQAAMQQPAPMGPPPEAQPPDGAMMQPQQMADGGMMDQPQTDMGNSVQPVPGMQMGEDSMAEQVLRSLAANNAI
tara:strand:+ start:2160 stop:4328 length:2169 start_codon:yes stop_codon:yes gene_type:complete